MDTSTKTPAFRDRFYDHYVSTFKGDRDEVSDLLYQWSQQQLLPLFRELRLDSEIIVSLGRGAEQMLQFLER